jgi:preprotein translocase subunit SecA
MAHIDDMDELKRGIGLRAYGQKNPVVEYRIEGFDMFDAMIDAICEDTIRMLFTVQVRVNEEPKREQVLKAEATSGSDGSLANAPRTVKKKPGRNDPCPCGSGKKYKKCCGFNDN